jgi:hypothetical protein
MRWRGPAAVQKSLHNEDLHNLYSLLNISIMAKPKKMRREEKVVEMGVRGSACRILVGNPEEKERLLGRTRRR